MKIFKSLVLCILMATAASAQKLPQTQIKGVWAPQSIKIDGIADEWGTFQAYNKATNVFYTISNDDTYLYLAVQATDPVIINKITTSGATLTIAKGGNTTAVTFPAYDKENKAIFDIMINAPKGKSAINKLEIDTFITARNQMRTMRQKIIRVARNDKENDVFIYNDEGLKVAGRINANLSYTQEMAIPLAYLGITAGGSFNYSLQLNGQIPKGAVIPNIGRPDIITFTGSDGKNYMIGHATPENLILAYPTDFKADYTLAKK